MADYAFLVLPSTNRVYGRDAPRLARAELAALNQTVLGSALSDIAESRIGGVAYVTFSAGRLRPRELAWLSNHSALYALFSVNPDGSLQPVEVTPLRRLDDDLVTIQRYSGKTNEQFTKLLLNVTLACCRRGTAFGSDKLRVLDPLAGRGTTLNHALVYGFDAAGVEIDRAPFDAYAAFLKTWLRDKRFKHTVEDSSVRRGGRIAARRIDLRFAPTKQEMRSGSFQHVRFVQDDSRNALEHFKQESFDAVVADLPYGIQHASRLERHTTPGDLLHEALPIWIRLLRHGGGIGLSWNARVLPREDVIGALEGAGARTCRGAALEDLSHRVDAAILRDVVVAERP